jgi:hypothetical protein
MWRIETYRAIAEEFAVGVGVATQITFTDIKADPNITKPSGRKRYQSVSDEVRVNRIIADAVHAGKYREVSRRTFWLQRDNPEWTNRKVWSKAWQEIAGKRKPKRKSENGKV